METILINNIDREILFFPDNVENMSRSLIYHFKDNIKIDRENYIPIDLVKPELPQNLNFSINRELFISQEINFEDLSKLFIDLLNDKTEIIPEDHIFSYIAEPELPKLFNNE